MATLLATVRASVAVTYSTTVGLATITPSVTIPSVTSFAVASGTGANQADLLYQAVRSHTGVSSIDVRGVLTDLYGATINAVEIVTLIIYNKHATAVLAMGGGSNAVAAFATAREVRPGIHLIHCLDATGMVVTAGTGDILQFDAGGSTIDYEIGLICRSA